MDKKIKSIFDLNDFIDPNKFHGDIDISPFPIEFYIDSLKKMKLIRRAEEILGDNVKNGKIKCPCHLSIGQEAIPVGIAKYLDNKDNFELLKDKSLNVKGILSFVGILIL